MLQRVGTLSASIMTFDALIKRTGPSNTLWDTVTLAKYHITLP